MSIAVCLPSRGYVYSRLMESLLRNTAHRTDVKFFFSHGKRIPDCHNHIANQAMDAGCDYLWFVEDDHYLPDGILDKLLAMDADVAACDYPIGRFGHVITTYTNGFKQTGFGCTLIKRSVFEKLERPYFSTKMSYSINGDTVYPIEVTDENQEHIHGQHDVDFYYRLWKMGITIETCDTPVGHYFFVEPKLPKVGNFTADEYICELWEFDNVRVIDSDGNKKEL